SRRRTPGSTLLPSTTLFRSHGNADILVFLATMEPDADGNLRPRLATEGVPARARIQPTSQSGTSARRAEQDNEGYESEEMYSLRFARGHEVAMDQHSVVEWDGDRWHVFGYPL